MFVVVLVFSVRLLAIAVDSWSFLEFFELLSFLRKDEDNTLQFSRAINRRRCCVHDIGDGHDEDAAGERGCITF